MPIYRVHFKWKGRDITLKAKSLDLTHPYFVSIRELVLPAGKRIIIDPSEDDVRRDFGRAEHIMIPFQTVSLIEEFRKDPDEFRPGVKEFPDLNRRKAKPSKSAPAKGE